MTRFPLAIAFGAPTLADCLRLAVLSLGGQDNIRETSYFDLYTPRSGLVDPAGVCDDLFRPGAGTTIMIASKRKGEVGVVCAPNEDLSCWLGLTDITESEERVAAMLGDEKLLLLAIGDTESPPVTDRAIAKGTLLEGSEDYAFAAATRTDISDAFRLEINHDLLRGYPPLAWVAPLFAALQRRSPM